MQDPFIELQEKRNELTNAISDFEKWGRLKAK